jgi:hypothetical protein
MSTGEESAMAALPTDDALDNKPRHAACCGGTPLDGLWRNGNFLLLWGGQAVSTLGTRVSALALPFLVLALTHPPAQAGSSACPSAPSSTAGTAKQ